MPSCSGDSFKTEGIALFIFAARHYPAQIEFDGPRHFKFSTPRPCEVEENNIFYGRLYRCVERWQERPVIVLLDGSPSVGYHSALPMLARRFNRAGFNVATLVAPYHLQRRPRRPSRPSWRHTYFTGRNCLADAGMKFNLGLCTKQTVIVARC